MMSARILKPDQHCTKEELCHQAVDADTLRINNKQYSLNQHAKASTQKTLDS